MVEAAACSRSRSRSESRRLRSRRRLLTVLLRLAALDRRRFGGDAACGCFPAESLVPRSSIKSRLDRSSWRSVLVYAGLWLLPSSNAPPRSGSRVGVVGAGQGHAADVDKVSGGEDRAERFDSMITFGMAIIIKNLGHVDCQMSWR